MKRIILPAALVALAFMTAGCGRVSRPEVDNVIYLIGDGMGKKTGIVVNTTLTEATPGAFFAGVTSRYKVFDIPNKIEELIR